MAIRVLVVDDSLFMRRLVSDMLNADPGIHVVGTARDGTEAVKKIPKMKPDVVTLDLMMPGLDGLTTLKHIMAECPTPVIILSAHSREGADVTLECLSAGAVSFVLKPSGELSLDIHRIEAQLLQEVRAASEVDVGQLAPLVTKKPKERKRLRIGKEGIVVIGASTGGPQTLEAILSSLPAGFPVPIIAVQHVPSRYFTESLAKRLNGKCALVVKVAEDGDVLEAGKVYVAPAGFRMTVEPRDAGTGPQDAEPAVCLSAEEPESLSPSIDETMKSVAQFCKGNSVGVILSGMGRDGQKGMQAIKECGGRTIAQDKSSLVFGMPRAVIDAGLADEALPMNEIGNAMMECVAT